MFSINIIEHANLAMITRMFINFVSTREIRFLRLTLQFHSYAWLMLSENSYEMTKNPEQGIMTILYSSCNNKFNVEVSNAHKCAICWGRWRISEVNQVLG